MRPSFPPPSGLSSHDALTRRNFVQRLIGGTSISLESVSRIVGGAALSAWGVVNVRAQGATLFPIEDATLHEATPGDSSGTNGSLVVGVATGKRIDAALRFDELSEFVSAHGATSTFHLTLTITTAASPGFGAIVAYASRADTDASDATSPPWADDDAGFGSATSGSHDGLSAGSTISLDVTTLVTAMASNAVSTIRLRRQSLASDGSVEYASVEAGASTRPVIVTQSIATPTASPALSPTPTPSPSASLWPTATPSAAPPSPTPTSTPAPTPSATPAPTPSATPDPSASNSPTPTPTPFPTPTPSPTSSLMPTPTATPPSSAPFPTPSPSPLPPVVLTIIQEITGRESNQLNPTVTLQLRAAIASFQSAPPSRLRVLLTALINQLTGLRRSIEVDAPLNTDSDARPFDAANGEVEYKVELSAAPGTYFVRAQAITPFGLGPPSNEISFVLGNGPCLADPPTAPGTLVAIVNGVDLTLTWTAADGATSYVLEAGSAPGVSDVFHANVGAGTSLRTRHVPGTYYVRVRGTNVCGVGPSSNEVEVRLTSGTVAPGMPANLTADVAGRNVRLSWLPPSSGGLAVDYVLQAGTTPGGVDAGTQAINGTAVAVPEVPRGRYYVRVAARNEAGIGPATPELVVDVQ